MVSEGWKLNREEEEGVAKDLGTADGEEGCFTELFQAAAAASAAASSAVLPLFFGLFPPPSLLNSLSFPFPVVRIVEKGEIPAPGLYGRMTLLCFGEEALLPARLEEVEEGVKRSWD